MKLRLGLIGILCIAMQSALSRDVAVDEQARIDAWLEQQQLNEYGDPADTMYAGGSPLFDEKTGKFTERYAHIVDKFCHCPWN
jgi:hypothetical protein